MIDEFVHTLDAISPEIRAKSSRLVEMLRAPAAPAPLAVRALEMVPADFSPPTQAELFETPGRFPGDCVLLGVGPDESVFHLDLENPVSGSVLILGDRTSDRLGLLRSMVASALRLNPAEQVHISAITDRTDDFMEFAAAPHLQEILPVNDPGASELILELAGEAAERAKGKAPKPTLLFVIDDLAQCLTYLDQESYYKLYWLIRHGPRYRIWVVASLPSNRYDQAGERYLSAFRTRLIGHIRDPRLSAKAAQSAPLPTERLRPNQFFIPYLDECFVFFTCPID